MLERLGSSQKFLLYLEELVDCDVIGRDFPGRHGEECPVEFGIFQQLLLYFLQLLICQTS